MSITSGPADGECTGKSYVLPFSVSFAVSVFSAMVFPSRTCTTERAGAFSFPSGLTAPDNRQVSAAGILEAGDGFFLPKDQHHVEHTRADRASSERRAQRSRKLAKFHVMSFG